MSFSAVTVIAFIGPAGSGKTTNLDRLGSMLQKRGLKIGGISQPVLLKEQHRVGYEIRDQVTGERQPFAWARERPTPRDLGFYFVPEAWAWAAQRIVQARSTAEVLLVDELGWLETQGEGHWPALADQIPDEKTRVYVITARPECALLLEARLGKFRYILTPPLTSEAEETLVAHVLALLADTHELPNGN